MSNKTSKKNSSKKSTRKTTRKVLSAKLYQDIYAPAAMKAHATRKMNEAKKTRNPKERAELLREAKQHLADAAKYARVHPVKRAA